MNQKRDVQKTLKELGIEVGDSSVKMIQVLNKIDLLRNSTSIFDLAADKEGNIVAKIVTNNEKKEMIIIDLKFKGKIETLVIYFEALKSFVDPSVSFTLNLDIDQLKKALMENK